MKALHEMQELFVTELSSHQSCTSKHDV
jgi:hypothetical protein